MKKAGRIKPFLALPFKKGTPLKITEGWFYSDEERKIHRHKFHRGIDFATDRGTPVYAPADGWAISSFHYQKRLSYQRKLIGLSLGNFVQIWHSDQKYFTQYAHLESYEKSIPYFEPVKDGDVWYPSIVNYPIESLLKDAKFVKKGTLIGYVGDSGLSADFNEAPDHKTNRMKYPAWDETHLHFEIYQRTSTGRKKNQIDPFGIYGKFDQYSITGELWLTDKDGNILYAK